MTDATLLAFGCGVSFIALAGAYVYFRERFVSRTGSERGKHGQPVPVRVTNSRG